MFFLKAELWQGIALLKRRASGTLRARATVACVETDIDNVWLRCALCVRLSVLPSALALTTNFVGLTPTCAMRPPVVLKAKYAVTTCRESSNTASAAILPAAHVAEAVAANDPPERLVGVRCPRLLL